MSTTSLNYFNKNSPINRWRLEVSENVFSFTTYGRRRSVTTSSPTRLGWRRRSTTWIHVWLISWTNISKSTRTTVEPTEIAALHQTSIIPTRCFSQTQSIAFVVIQLPGTIMRKRRRKQSKSRPIDGTECDGRERRWEGFLMLLERETIKCNRKMFKITK